MYNFTQISDEAKHTAAHVLAAAVLKLYPKTKIGIGPVTKQGFYYEFEFARKISDKDLEKIEQEANKIRSQGHTLFQIFMSKEEALNMMLQRGQIYKAEILKTIPDQEVSFYKLADFTDLCRGPHLKTTSELGPIKIIKLDTAHWQDDSTRPLLQRILGMTFASEAELQEFNQLKIEEVNRDYTNLLEISNLGRVIDDSVLLNESGTKLLSKIEQLIDINLFESKSKEIYVNNVDNIEELSEHIDAAFNFKTRSPREFPITLKSSAFLEDDFLNEEKQSHKVIFARKYASNTDAFDLLPQITNIINLFKLLGLDLKSEIFYAKDDDDFVETLSNIFQKEGVSHTKVISTFSSNTKIKFIAQDVLNRNWNIAEYIINANFSSKSTSFPIKAITIHINPFRILAYILENTKGKLPRILSPNEVTIIPINNKRNSNYASIISKRVNELGYIANEDLTSKSVNKKIYLANKLNSTLQLLVGDKEEQTQSVSLRHLDKDLGLISVDELAKSLGSILNQQI